MSTQKNDPRALALGVSCYVIWGFFPLYFSLLSPAGAVEVIVHRAVWGLFFCLVALALTGSLGKIRALIADRGALWRLAVAGALVVVNWSVYVYAVLAGHTTDAAVGYFINPLVTIALGLIVLRERVTPIQKVALALGVVAVVILVIGQRSVPIVSLTLALTFGLYSLVKKDVAARVDPLAGMAIETAAVSPVLLGYYAYLAATSSTSFHTIASSDDSGVSWVVHLALLVGAGALTIHDLAGTHWGPGAPGGRGCVDDDPPHHVRLGGEGPDPGDDGLPAVPGAHPAAARRRVHLPRDRSDVPLDRDGRRVGGAELPERRLAARLRAGQAPGAHGAPGLRAGTRATTGSEDGTAHSFVSPSRRGPHRTLRLAPRGA